MPGYTAGRPCIPVGLGSTVQWLYTTPCPWVLNVGSTCDSWIWERLPSTLDLLLALPLPARYLEI